jgi:hypothetical protein
MLIDAAKDAMALPNFANVNEVRPYISELAGDAVDICYALGGKEKATAALEEAMLTASVDAVITEEQWAEHVQAKCCAADPGKFGDGKFLEFIRSVDWAKIIQTIMTIIAVIPKSDTSPGPVA